MVAIAITVITIIIILRSGVKEKLLDSGIYFGNSFYTIWK